MLLADVDGTLVTQDKILTDRAIAAVGKLKQAGVLFAITSGRPPRGMSMLIEPLGLSTPIAAFNGGVFVHPDMSVIEQRVLPDSVTPAVIKLLDAHGVDVWVYRGADWFVRNPQGPHVARETWTVKFDPTPVDSFAAVSDGVAKVVGVSDDYDAVQRAVAQPASASATTCRRRNPSRTTATSPTPTPTRAPWPATSRRPTGFPRRRSPPSVTAPTTC
jgi:hypothetical protein